ncbi:hypothetical protein SS50377_23407 [Spironucleus salmonicida]|uniref:Uncharacterized protein n=1 Tax=Spironucleus salmonicida TaxID=348837 RepID=V6LSQ2_9EUKA|nr:hypothetical protein SS50377_23407 [Spironucleus salmonicida]|eukprot:EST47278.1 Hypothetical protein SS50377_12788 [Spironucleus salmonicida]
MTNIFESFKTSAADKITVAAFQDLCQRQLQIQTTVHVNISVYGVSQSGKTALSLKLAQCPYITTSPSIKTGIINSLLVPIRARPAKLTIMDMHKDSPFMLTDIIFITLNLSADSIQYYTNIIQQLFQHQLCVLYITKIDLLTQEQYANFTHNFEILTKILVEKEIQYYAFPISLEDKNIYSLLSSILYECYQHSRLLQAQRALQDSENELNIAKETNSKLQADKFNEMQKIFTVVADIKQTFNSPTKLVVGDDCVTHAVTQQCINNEQLVKQLEDIAPESVLQPISISDTDHQLNGIDQVININNIDTQLNHEQQYTEGSESTEATQKENMPSQSQYSDQQPQSLNQQKNKNNKKYKNRR